MGAVLDGADADVGREEDVERVAFERADEEAVAGEADDGAVDADGGVLGGGGGRDEDGEKDGGQSRHGGLSGMEDRPIPVRPKRHSKGNGPPGFHPNHVFSHHGDIYGGQIVSCSQSGKTKFFGLF